MRLHLALIVMLLTTSPTYGAQLVMFKSDTCEWCETWDDVIAPIYPKTAEGRQAPLRRVDIHDTRPPDLEHLRGIHFTPTFVLIAEGREIGRITGYPGEDFFWGLLEQLIRKLPATVAASCKKEGLTKC